MVREKDILCVNLPEWKEEKKWRRRRTHISEEEKKKPSKNQVIKLFMKNYMKEEKEAKKAKPSDRWKWKKSFKLKSKKWKVKCSKFEMNVCISENLFVATNDEKSTTTL